MIPDHSLFKNFLSGERIQKVTDSDTPDTRGRKPNPQRKNCGFKNIRIRVDGASRYYEKPAGDNVPGTFSRLYQS